MKILPPLRVNPLLVTVLSTVALAWGGPTAADSDVIFNPANGHFYQRFDTSPAGWSLAKGKCQTLLAHLVTFTDTAEHDFVYGQLVSKAPVTDYKYFWLGATYNPDTVSWSWITGEKFPFTFGFGSEDENALIMAAPNGDYVYADPNGYELSPGLGGLENAGYVCEWDGNTVTGSASVPDLNDNGAPEIALLYLDYKTNRHTVLIRDAKTHAETGKLLFGAGPIPPTGLAVLADLNGNGAPEIAVLSGLKVQIKDAKDTALPSKTISFFNSAYQARALSVMPDSNHNGFDELTVLGVQKNGKITAQTRDSSTAELLFSDTF